MNSGSPPHDTLQSVQRPCRTWEPRVLSVRSEPSFGGICPPHPQYLQLPRSTATQRETSREDQGRQGRQHTGINNPKSRKQEKDKHLDRESDTHTHARTHTHTSPNRHSVCNRANNLLTFYDNPGRGNS